MAAKKSGTLVSAKRAASIEKLKAYSFKPGVSGNPSGRSKKLTGPLEAFLARKDKSGKQYAELLIEAMVKRAISRSDTLIKEIFDRVEGHVANAEEAQLRGNTIIIDIPRPPKLPINVSGNGHKPEEDE